MRDVIWKYPFDVEDEFELDLPVGARFLKVDIQVDQPVMWFQVPVAYTDKEVRKFNVLGTGSLFDPRQLDYRGTFKLALDNFIGHLYEVVGPQ